MKQFNLGCFGGVGLGLLMILCPWVQQGQIEKDLTQATKAALEGRGLSDWDISFSGLDATLRGPASEADTVRALVSKVPGIQQVQIVTPEQEAALQALRTAKVPEGGPSLTGEGTGHSSWSPRGQAGGETGAESINTLNLPTVASSKPSPTPTPLPSPTAPPSPSPSVAPTPAVAASPSVPVATRTGLLQILRHDGRVYVRGVYPDAESRQAVVAAAKVAFGASSVADETALSVGGPPMGWPRAVLKALPALRAVQELELAAGGDVVILSGRGGGDAALKSLKAQVPPSIVVENRLEGRGTPPTSGQGSGMKAEALRQSQMKLDTVVRRGEVRFATASSRLKPETYAYLDLIASTIQEQAGVHVLVGGHTDSEGDATVNRRLSQKRADAVRVYLISQGIPARAIFAQGYGSTQPVASNTTEEGRRRNRRIAFTLR